jgi:peptide/nickel transport system substrate-binding protein
MGPAPQEQGSRRTRRFRFRGKITTAVGVSAVALALAAAGCSSSGGSSTNSSSSGGTKVKGGTAVWAEPPSTTPNYIFPFTSSAYISVINASNFTNLMYRPLYWFGNGAQPLVNPSLSLANQPTWSGNTATITLKHYMWSDGTPVTTADVMFWVNMLKAVGQTDWGAYTGFPDAFVKSIKVVSPTELQMTTNKTYSHTWFLYNDLSQITPMPPAWDKTASGPSHCATTVSDCAKVYKYLDSQSKNLSGYASSPLWGVVDGPWKLSAFNADGHITFVPNPKYSGPVKPSLSQFQEVPFTTDAAEYNVLRSPAAGGQKISVGYLPSQDAPAKPAGSSPLSAGANPLSGYSLAPLYVWGINYFVVNFQSSTGNGPIINQLYFRQALAYLLNQEAVIKGPLRGYGTLTQGPVGSTPVSKYLSPELKGGPVFPYNPTKAKDLLSSHGWSVTPNGVTKCTDPSKCGPGIKQGQGLQFNLPYATGTQWITQEMEQLQSNASRVGIKINLEPKPFNQVTALAAGNCKVVHIPCDWDIANWGGGWSFAPDYEPTGETLFMSGAPANSGGYSSKQNDAYIQKTLTSDNLQYMYTWENYLAQQLPVIFQPNGVYTLTEIANNLRGVTPQSPTLTFNPENWYFVK